MPLVAEGLYFFEQPCGLNTKLHMTRSRYFLGMSALFLAVVLVGFSRSLYLRTYFEFPEITLHLYLHGIALTAWFTLAFPTMAHQDSPHHGTSKGWCGG